MTTKCNDKTLSFEEKELCILRNAVDKAEAKTGKKMNSSSDIASIIGILEQFLRRKKLICYGGTAINNILPVNDQFYNKDIEIPDYDFYSPKAIADAKELADIYAKQDYLDIEVRAGVHVGTYKLYVNFIQIADITQLEPTLYKVLLSKSIRKNGISYAPPDFLRLNMYQELASPAGDVSRWEKVYKRLILLNKHYPLKNNPKCSELNFMRDFTGNAELNDTIYDIVKNTMIDEGVVFIGGYASSLYGRYMPAQQRKQLQHVPDFDVLSLDPMTTALIVKERLEDAGFKNVKINKKPKIDDEMLLEHYEVVVENDTVCFIYKPNGCYSFNTISIEKKVVNVATIETMLLFLLAFTFSDRPYYDVERILCMAQYLFNVQAVNRLNQKGLLKRFTIECYGNDETLTDIRSKKAEKYKELKLLPDMKEYEKYFLKYVPPRSLSTSTSTSSSLSANTKNKKYKRQTFKRGYIKKNNVYDGENTYDGENKKINPKINNKRAVNKTYKSYRPKKNTRKNIVGKLFRGIF
jgi:hypothetical protein